MPVDVEIRLPVVLLSVLSEFARRRDVPVEAMIAEWIGSRAREERMLASARVPAGPGPPRFPLIDRAGDGGHYLEVDDVVI